MLSNNQRRDYLLCEECEQKTGRWESYAARLARQDDGTLPIFGLLTPTPLDGISTAAGVDVDAMTRFAASVFWRTSVSAAYPTYSLGSHSEEAMRRYLNSGGHFPKTARLTLAVIQATHAPVDQVITSPSSRRVDGFHHEHVFIALGLHFILSVGSRFPVGVDNICFASTRLVALSDGTALRDRLLQLGTEARVEGALMKHFAMGKR